MFKLCLNQGSKQIKKKHAYAETLDNLTDEDKNVTCKPLIYIKLCHLLNYKAVGPYMCTW